MRNRKIAVATIAALSLLSVSASEATTGPSLTGPSVNPPTQQQYQQGQGANVVSCGPGCVETIPGGIIATQNDVAKATGTISNNVQMDDQWLAEVVAAEAEQETNQMKEDLQGDSNIASSQDDSLVAAQKQEQVTEAQNKEQSCLQAANNMCKESGSSSMNTAQTAGVSALGVAPAIADIMNGGSGSAPKQNCTSQNCYGWNAGKAFPSKADARNNITSQPAKNFDAADSFLPVVTTPLAKGVSQMNNYVANVANPAPEPALPSKQQNTPMGKEYQAKVREEQALMSLAQASLLDVGANNVPTTNISQATSTGQAGGASANTGFANTLKQLAGSGKGGNTTGQYVSNDQYLKAYAESFYYNPAFYKDVAQTLAQNPNAYRQQMLYFKAAELEMEYRIMRSEEYTQATDAALLAMKTRQYFSPQLKEMRRAAANGQAKN